MAKALFLCLPAAAGVWVPVMHDNFDAELDMKTWSFHGTSSHKFPDELQHYTSEDAYTENGTLVMRTRLNPFQVGNVSYPYTSGAVDSSAGFTHTFGRWQGFAQLPPSSDSQVWPALWLTPLGTAPSDRSCWPMCGEFDIMEFWAGRGDTPTAKASYHMGNACGKDSLGGEVGSTSAGDAQQLTSYNLYAMEWTADKVEFFFNERSIGSISGAQYEIPTWPMGWRINQAVCGQAYCSVPSGPVQHDSYFRLDFVSVLDYHQSTYCDDGIQAGQACCPKSCGLCGGTSCNHRPGGDACCTGSILASGRQCSSASDTGCIVPALI